MRALPLLRLGWRREERLLSGGDMRPARTLVRAFANRTIGWPETPFRLGQVFRADAIGRGQVVVAPADEVSPVALFDVMAVGSDD